MNLWLHQGLLWIHVGGGLAALASGAAAVVARKGNATHAAAGTSFFAAMLVLGVTASILEPFRSPALYNIVGFMV
jgi:hypothetical protein